MLSPNITFFNTMGYACLPTFINRLPNRRFVLIPAVSQHHLGKIWARIWAPT